MRALCSPTLSMALRIALRSGALANFTSTVVPLLNSTPVGIWCQKSIEKTPATLKISENARKYHFLPRKSMFVFLKNSTCFTFVKNRRTRLASDAQGLAALFALQAGVEDHAGDENSGKNIGQQTKSQRDCKSLHGSGAEQEQDEGGNNRGHVGIDNRDPGLAEALIHCRSRALAVTQLFPDALEDEHVRVNTHTDGQDDTGNSGQSQRVAKKSHEPQQDNQVQDQSQIRVDACKPVIKQHEEHDHSHAHYRCGYTLADGVNAQRGTDTALFQNLDSRRQRPGFKLDAQIFGALLGEAALDDSLIVNFLFNGGKFDHPVIEHDGQIVANMGAGKVAKAVAAVTVQRETYNGGAGVAFGGGLGVANIASGNHRTAIQHIDLIFGPRVARAYAAAVHENCIGRQIVTVSCQGLLFGAINPLVNRAADLQHGRGGNNADGAIRIYARKLDQNLIAFQGVFFNKRLSHTQGINALANGFDSLGDGLLFNFTHAGGLQAQHITVIGAGADVILLLVGGGIQNIVAKVGDGIGRDAFDYDLLGMTGRVGLIDVAIRNLVFAEQVLEALDGDIGIGVHRVVHLHLKDQVGAAFQVEAEMDAL